MIIPPEEMPLRIAPVKLTPLTFPDSLTPERMVPTRLTFFKFATVMEVFERSAPGPTKKPLRKYQPDGKIGVPVTAPDLTPVRSALSKLAPCNLAPGPIR